MRFGRLVALHEAGRKDGFVLWECKCDCGGVKVATRSRLTSGKIKSCGCMKSGISKGPEYRCWLSMIHRCKNNKRAEWDSYGGRGINVCDRWVNGDGQKSGAECFLEDMGKRPSKDHSIDRIDNMRGYEPLNCRWATRSEQQRNTRRSNVINGQHALDLCEKHGIKYTTFKQRIIYGFSVEEALSPIDFRSRRRKIK